MWDRGWTGVHRPQYGHVLCAIPLRTVAPGLKAAARRQARQVRHLAGNDGQGCLSVRQIRNGAEQPTRVGVSGRTQEVVGSALLLTHSHAIANLKEQLLIEISHLLLGVMGLIAGTARWLQLRADGRLQWVTGWVWPVMFVLIGLLLLGYREA